MKPVRAGEGRGCPVGGGEGLHPTWSPTATREQGVIKVLAKNTCILGARCHSKHSLNILNINPYDNPLSRY